MTDSVAGEDFKAHLEELVVDLGPYPHAKIDASQVKKQSTRMNKIVCPECGYLVRTTKKWLEVGLPTCCCGTQMEVPEEDSDDE